MIGNTVGSLSQVQHDIIVGSLLGDATMRCKVNSLIEFNHSFKQSKYVWWKYFALKDFVSTAPKERCNGKNRTSCRFTTRSLQCFNEYFELFYLNRYKTIPESIGLSPLSLAVWFMDDGSKSRDALYLNTQQFGYYGSEKLAGMLRNQFGFEARINKDSKYFRLRFTNTSSLDFQEIIRPHLLEHFEYKLVK